MSYKELSRAVAIALTLIAFFTCIRSIFKEEIKPHAFPRVIWAATAFVVFLARFADNEGAGAWPTGVSGSIAILIALLACFKRTDISITRTDCLFLSRQCLPCRSGILHPTRYGLL